MDKRRHYKKENKAKHDMTDKEIRWKCKQVKKRTGQMCSARKLKTIIKRFKSLHKWISELAGRKTKYSTGCMKSNEGRVIMGKDNTV